jgi:hypothetical protein
MAENENQIIREPGSVGEEDMITDFLGSLIICLYKGITEAIQPITKLRLMSLLAKYITDDDESTRHR